MLPSLGLLGLGPKAQTQQAWRTDTSICSQLHSCFCLEIWPRFFAYELNVEEGPTFIVLEYPICQLQETEFESVKEYSSVVKEFFSPYIEYCNMCLSTTSVAPDKSTRELLGWKFD